MPTQANDRPRISAERLAAGRAKIAAGKAARAARVASGERTQAEITNTRWLQLHDIQNVATVRNYRHLRTSEGSTWSFSTIDHAGLNHLHVLVQIVRGVFDVRVSNASTGERFDSSVEGLVSAVNVWAANTARWSV